MTAIEEMEDLNGRQVRVGACLLAEDMESMVRFYRDILGFNTQWDGENFAEFETASGELSFFMYSRKQFTQAMGESYVPPKGINLTFEIALWLPCFADVDAEYERLSKLGVRFPAGKPQTFSFGIRNFYVADPEGNLLEIGSTRET
jgi:catechol 2,3-dioxygenase-like lactoylglutathione lyase family enzyme